LGFNVELHGIRSYFVEVARLAEKCPGYLNIGWQELLGMKLVEGHGLFLKKNNRSGFKFDDLYKSWGLLKIQINTIEVGALAILVNLNNGF